MQPQQNTIATGKLARRLLIASAMLAVAVVLLLPLVAIFYQALALGLGSFLAAITHPDAVHAIFLTLLVAVISVPINTLFGVMLAWLVTRFEFFGRKLLLTLIDIPFAVSPVIAGLLYLLLYGNNGLIGKHFAAVDVQIMFAFPGILLVTIFVTSPFVARELIPLMQQQGHSEAEAALSLGASGWQMFRKVSLPAIKWALIYGVILCNARAIGEFGAVSVVSGNIRGATNTLPLHVELLYQDYQSGAAFAAAALLALMAIATLLLKTAAKWQQQKKLQRDENGH